MFTNLKFKKIYFTCWSFFAGHQAHHNAIFDIAWAPNEMRLVSGSGDHTAVLWDVQESGQLQEVARFHAHTRSVKTVAFPRDDKSESHLILILNEP